MEQPEENNLKESTVKTLQAYLFPPQISNNSYFSSFFIKPNLSDEDDEDKLKTREVSSKELFPYNQDTVFTSQQARWPTECQVLENRITHINYVPPSYEPYYSVTGNEPQPKPTGDDCGVIIYQYMPISAVNYFSRSCVGGSRYLLSTNPCPEDESLQFESRFESGNLATAIRITPNYYELQLRADLYTNRHMQWFYFKVTNMKKQFLYRFSITNCTKEQSLYSEGMRPLMYSVKDAQLHSIGWRRCGQNITYFCNENVTQEDPDQQMTYTLTFTIEFPHDNDEVYLAHSYPYTYTDLQDYLMELTTHPVKSTFTSVRLLCKTLAGNNVYLVTITSPTEPDDLKTLKKRAIVVTARVHPGETPSSWMMKGILDFLTSESGPAKELRDKFIFKIVPMLNPDGVIVGNNRCSLSAKDLNRQYRTVMRDSYPSIWYTKLMVRRLLEECGVALYCDFHAHSRKHNIFVYGCENRRGSERKLHEQVFPLMLHKNSADKFSFESCKFRVTKAKEGTGRIVMWMMGIANSYTMEASFAGSTMGGRIESHFTTQDFEQMGKSFCQTLLDYYDEDPRKEKLRVKIIDRLAKEGSNADEPTNINLSDYSSDDGDTSSTSSNEVGRDEEEFIVPTVAAPPPSPVTIKKTKPKSAGGKQKTIFISKSPSAPRKPLPMVKATLKLFDKNSWDGDTSSESEDDKPPKPRAIRRCKKRKSKKKKIVSKLRKLKIKKNRKRFKRDPKPEPKIVHPLPVQKSVSVFDLLPTTLNFGSATNLIYKHSKTPQAKYTFISEKKTTVSNQLEEVQAKLYTLKNKLWFGCESGDVPFSWSKGIYYRSSSPLKKCKKDSKKKVIVDDRSDKKTVKDVKIKPPEVVKDSKTKKKQNGLKRQTAVEWSMNVNNLRIRKSKSLTETSKLDLAWNVGEDKGNNKKKKKIKHGKLEKKSKTLSLVKTFTS